MGGAVGTTVGGATVAGGTSVGAAVGVDAFAGAIVGGAVLGTVGSDGADGADTAGSAASTDEHAASSATAKENVRAFDTSRPYGSRLR